MSWKSSPQQPSLKVKISPPLADLLQRSDSAEVLFGEADVMDAWGVLEGLKAADCAAAAHPSFSVTFAQSCYTAQKLLPPDIRTCHW